MTPPPTLWQRWTLLELSGELPAWKQRLLQRRLARDPALRAHRDAMIQLTSGLAATPTPPLPADVRATLLEAARDAREHEPEPSASVPAMPGPSWAFAAAAVVILLAAGWWWTSRAPDAREHVAVEPATEIGIAIDALFADVLDEPDDSVETVLLLAAFEDPYFMSLDDLAAELLLWETNL